MATCYRHPKRQTGVACSNCDRPICTDCMTPTNVGMRCPECARQRTRVHRVRPGTRDAPVATQAIVAVNVIVFLAELLTARGGFGQVIGTVYEKGGLYGPLIAHEHEYWRLVSSGFLHAGLLHILLNMYFIWVIGSMLEPAIGSARFVALYAVSLLCGSFGALLLTPNAFTVGASGAAFGLLGGLIVEGRSRGMNVSGLILLAALNFAFTFSQAGISVGGHVGGFVSGLLVGVLFDQADRRRLPHWISLPGCAAIAAAAAIAGVVVA